MTTKRKTARRPRACGPEQKETREAQARLPRSTSGEAEETAKGSRYKFDLGVDPKKIDETLETLRKQVTRWVKKGVADKVRISYKGKPLAPDIPVAYFLAAEAITFWATGLLRVLIVNLGAKAFLQIELISSAEEHYAEGKERYMEGDITAAIAAFQRGVDADDYHAPSHLMLGICQKVRGNDADARKHFERAAELDPKGDTGKKARENLKGRAAASSDSEE